ncbi:hypothetical protein M5689_001678 [Euphorbia peplus]|nr:hypothetical protein M5689_001678 [Euphorbia peplus]
MDDKEGRKNRRRFREVRKRGLLGEQLFEGRKNRRRFREVRKRGLLGEQLFEPFLEAKVSQDYGMVEMSGSSSSSSDDEEIKLLKKKMKLDEECASILKSYEAKKKKMNPDDINSSTQKNPEDVVVQSLTQGSSKSL